MKICFQKSFQILTRVGSNFQKRGSLREAYRMLAAEYVLSEGTCMDVKDAHNIFWPLVIGKYELLL